MLLLGAGSVGAEYNEAPELAALVEEGELPPVEERLPDEPMVVEPWHEIGQYGGTWYRHGTATDWGHARNKMIGWSPTRWVDDGLRLESNWLIDWEANEDRTTWTLHIREGVRWSDGELLTADDILFWWEDMALNAEAAESPPDAFVAGGEPAEVTALDDYTVEVSYVDSAPLLPELMAMWVSGGMGNWFVMPKHYLSQFHPDYTDEYTDYETLEEKMDWWFNVDCPVLGEWMPVEHEVAERLVLERNPYYYAVDTEGNQLPYIDRMVTELVEEREVVLLQWMTGEADMQLRPYADMTDLSMLIDNQEEGDYRVKLWDSGSGTGPMFYWNWNHPDEQKRELYRQPEFRRAMSHALNRERLQDMLWFGLGRVTTGTISPKSHEFQEGEGQEVYEEWRDSFVEYDPEKAAELLDAIGVVDQNNDGWRQYPNGDELVLRIDYDADAGSTDIQTNEMAASDWEDVGLQVILNPMDGAALTLLDETAEFDIRNSWEVGSASPSYGPVWPVPVDLSRWAPLYGSWYQQLQLSTAHEQADKDPRDRTPPRKEPEEDGPVYRLQRIWDDMNLEVDWDERDAHALDIFRIHIEEGPFWLGTVKDYPRIVVVRNNFHNVPSEEDLALGGFVNPWGMAPYPAVTLPGQYYMTDE